MTREAALAAQRRAISEAETERADRRQARALRDRALLREIEQHPSTLGDRVVIQTEPFEPIQVVSRAVAAWITRTPRP